MVNRALPTMTTAFGSATGVAAGSVSDVWSGGGWDAACCSWARPVSEIVDATAIAIAAKWCKEILMNPPGFEVHGKATTGGENGFDCHAMRTKQSRQSEKVALGRRGKLRFANR